MMKKDIELMNNALKEHCLFHKIKYSVDTFSNPLEFPLDKHYDAVFLDIDMPEENGISLAKKINKNNPTRIIFVTQFASYMHTTFNVKPFHFINKEHLYNESILVLSLLFNELHSQMIRLKTKRGENSVIINDITHIDIEDGLTYIHTINDTYMTWDNITSLYDQLKFHGFGKANQSCLVSFNHIKDMKDNQILLEKNINITLSHRMQSSFKNSYKTYLMENL